MDTILRLLSLLFSGFSYSTRRKIGSRDKWTCTVPDCNKSFKNGWFVQAAHFDHNRKNGDYDDPDNGRILCVEHHLEEHMWRFREAKRQGDKKQMNREAYAIRKLREVDHRTYEYRKNHK